MGILDRLRNKPKTTSLAEEEYKRARAKAELEYAPKRAERDVQMQYEREIQAAKRTQARDEAKQHKSASSKVASGFGWMKKNMFTGDLNRTLGYSSGGAAAALGYGSSKRGKSSGGGFGGGGGMMAALGYSTPKSHHPRRHRDKKARYGRYRGKTVRLD